MADSVLKFLAEFPATPPVVVGLYSSAANGWVSLCIDTFPDHSYPKMGCTDFSHPEYALLEFPSWSAEYEHERPMIKRHDAKIVRHDHTAGDEAFNRPFFEFLMRVINDQYSTGNDVYRPTWAGVRILDSRCVSFGRVYRPKA